jgi:tRNA (guanine-N7-)-methyltransferase
LRPARLKEHVSHIAERRDELRSKVAEIIKPSSRFVWEVGCGHGHFLAAFAKAHPDENCIGVDIMSDRITRAERKRARGRLENLHFIRADAYDFLTVMAERARFTKIFILFPDPWPKRRHHKNRIVKPAFLTAAAARAQRGASLFFRTDHEPYFRDVAAMVKDHPDWSEPDEAPWPFEEPTVFQKRAARHFSLVATRR